MIPEQSVPKWLSDWIDDMLEGVDAGYYFSPSRGDGFGNSYYIGSDNPDGRGSGE